MAIMGPSLVNLNDTVELHNLENPFLMQDLWPYLLCKPNCG